MKKTVLASTLAVGLGVTGFAAGNSADAAEQGVDKAELANLAQSNPEQLNASPVQEGAYNYNFNYNGTNYNFESDGQTWLWSFGGGSSEDVSSEQTTSVEQPNKHKLNNQHKKYKLSNQLNKLLHKLNKHNNHNKKQLQKLQLNHQAQMKLQLAHQV